MPFSILTGLIFWVLSDFERFIVLDDVPQLILWWSPIATVSALIFLALASRKNYGRALALGAGLLAATAYAIFVSPTLQQPWKIEHYLVLVVIHIPLICWIAIGILVLGLHASAADRFAFLIKSIEVMITAGLYLIAGVAFGGITVGMFAALSITLPEIWIRLIAAGGFGLLPVLAVATIYDPTKLPSAQKSEQSLSQLVATMMRLLLLGATPVSGRDLSPGLQNWLRRGILAVTFLVALVSLSAMSATVYRTIQGGLTLNRLTIIGWNTINIGILIGLLYEQVNDDQERWVESLQVFFRRATPPDVWGVTGRYFVREKSVPSSKIFYDDLDICRRLGFKRAPDRARSHRGEWIQIRWGSGMKRSRPYPRRRYLRAAAAVLAVVSTDPADGSRRADHSKKLFNGFGLDGRCVHRSGCRRRYSGVTSLTG